MKTKSNEIFFTWPIWISLFLLLINDWLIKVHYPSVVSGKLSDFAGIYLVSSLGFYYFRFHKIWVITIVICSFTFWKSHFSQPFLDLWNAIGFIQYARVVDYYDLFAFLVIPLAYVLTAQYQKHLLLTRPIGILRNSIITITAFAVIATSVRKPLNSYKIQPIDGKSSKHDKNLKFEIFDILKSVCARRGMSCLSCDPSHNQGSYSNKNLRLDYLWIPEKMTLEINVIGLSTGMLSQPNPYPAMHRLQENLVTEFGHQLNTVEIVLDIVHK